MATWKKVIVSGSQAELAAVTASVALLVSTNQVISTTAGGTKLSGSFSGSFFGDGSGISGVAASFPVTAKTDLVSTDQFFINDGASKYVTYGNLLTDLAGTNLTVEANDSLTLASTITGITSISATSITASFTGSLTGALTGTASYATNALTASYASNVPVTASYANNAASASYASTATSASFASNANQLGGQVASYYTNASNINAGTIGNAYLPSAISVTSITASFTGSHVGTLTGTASYATTASYANNATSASYALNATTASYALTATSASYALTATSASFASNGGVTSIVAGTGITASSATGNVTVSIGQAVNTNSNVTFNDATINGNLVVAGTASFTNADNLTVKDKFILINSGSAALADSGWITQYNAAGSGSAFYLEAGAAGSTGTYGRFAVAYDVIGTSTALTADEFVVTAKSAAGTPPTDPTWGGATNGYGNIYVNSSTGDIFIYS